MKTIKFLILILIFSFISLTFITCTSGLDKSNYTIIWFSDPQNLPVNTWKNAVNLTNGLNPDAFFITGDLINSPYNDTVLWDNFMSGYNLTAVPINYTLAGNHDVFWGGNKSYPADFSFYDKYRPNQRNWSVTVGNNQFIGLSLGQNYSDPTVLTWLDNEIVKNSDKNIFVLTHWGHPYEEPDFLDHLINIHSKQKIFWLYGHDSPDPDTSLVANEIKNVVCVRHDPQRYNVSGGNGYYCKIDIYYEHVEFTMVSQIENSYGTIYPYHYISNLDVLNTTQDTTPLTNSSIVPSSNIPITMHIATNQVEFPQPPTATPTLPVHNSPAPTIYYNTQTTDQVYINTIILTIILLLTLIVIIIIKKKR